MPPFQSVDTIHVHIAFEDYHHLVANAGWPLRISLAQPLEPGGSGRLPH